MELPECPKSPDGYGHHWIPVPTNRKWAGERLNEMRCQHCNIPYREYLADTYQYAK